MPSPRNFSTIEVMERHLLRVKLDPDTKLARHLPKIEIDLGFVPVS